MSNIEFKKTARGILVLFPWGTRLFATMGVKPNGNPALAIIEAKDQLEADRDAIAQDILAFKTIDVLASLHPELAPSKRIPQNSEVIDNPEKSSIIQ